MAPLLTAAPLRSIRGDLALVMLVLLVTLLPSELVSDGRQQQASYPPGEEERTDEELEGELRQSKISPQTVDDSAEETPRCRTTIAGRFGAGDRRRVEGSRADDDMARVGDGPLRVWRG